ncbi:hypothetical protein HUT18_29945 [Streptomyces sp. NA04227]|nr:hypothetical protein HUT18_29945 [Streptomyces sp. NA04227]
MVVDHRPAAHAEPAETAAGADDVHGAHDAHRAHDPHAARGATAHPGRYAAGIPLRLAHRGPYQAAPVFDLLAREALPGIEEVTGDHGARTYRRTLRLPHGTGIVAVAERTGTSAGTGAAHPGGWLEARLHLTDLRDLTTAVHRLRRLFDLDADPFAVDERLGADPRLAPLVAARPGLRSPGAAEPEEYAVRALAGPAVAARLLAEYGTELERPCGSLTHLFPAPADLAGVEGPVGALAGALADGSLRLDAGADREEAHRALLAVPGLDARTAALIRTRALSDPDVPVPGEQLPETWRPWRSYARQHLYTEREFSS